MLAGPAGCDSGTRTEAGQNVPHEKPECAVASVLTVGRHERDLGARISWIAGETGLPQ